MRRALLPLLLIALPACDGADGSADSDAIVGTWTLDALTESIRVTSSTAQAIPDVSATPVVAVTASGARSLNLDVMVNLVGVSGVVDMDVATDEKWQSSLGANLSVIQMRGSAQATLTDAASGEQFFGFFGDGTVIARSGGRFSIPSLPLSGSGVVTVRGTVTYPEITLAPSRPTEVHPYQERLEGTLTVTFGDDGRFAAQSNGPGGSASATGTWQRVDADRVRLTVPSGTGVESGVFEASIASGALVLKGENLDRDAVCDAACIREVEPEVFADAGSLSAVSFVTTLRFRASN